LTVLIIDLIVVINDDVGERGFGTFPTHWLRSVPDRLGISSEVIPQKGSAHHVLANTPTLPRQHSKMDIPNKESIVWRVPEWIQVSSPHIEITQTNSQHRPTAD